MPTNKPKVPPAPAPAPAAEAAEAAEAAVLPPAGAEGKNDPKPDKEAAKEDGGTDKVFHNYQARKYSIRHPYQEVMVPVSGTVSLFKDSWIDVQVKAKVIVDLGPAK